MVQPNAIAENVFGILGMACWAAQLIPQIWKSWRSKSTTGLSEWLMLLWGTASVFLGVYIVSQRINIPLMMQPQLFSFLAFVSWGQCQYYGRGRSCKVSALLTVGLLVFFGVLEYLLVFAMDSIENDRSKSIATKFFGILAIVIDASALFPQYWEIYKIKAVIGISLTSITVDILGGVFSNLSLVFREDIDVIAAVQYSSVIFFDSMIVLAAIGFKVKHLMSKRKRAGDASELQEFEALPHLTVLSRLNSRIEDGPPAGSWLVTGVPSVFSYSAPCLQSQSEAGKLTSANIMFSTKVAMKEVDTRSM
ncbi:hypothetical protein FA15DRAFT_667752 [Coprinopsis marcescibilis]|uniref:PQ-loop-domain-containing protein n=1 Tax=Coprinopsis marcescibilis TaxID=230819 RepID=A0A5C3L0M0_COPMA|nr:hypothetical protein FA15DRAFT_667752 [Coprinopsis marcescibilis]